MSASSTSASLHVDSDGHAAPDGTINLPLRTDAAIPSPTRPPLQRKEASLSPRDDGPTATQRSSEKVSNRGLQSYDGNASSREDESLGQAALQSPLSDTVNSKDAMASDDSSAVTLQRLREAVNAKMMANHKQRTVLATSMPTRTSSGPVRRIASIREEGASSPNLSPTLNASFDSPLQTTSTESTESARTIKGSVPATPSATALRTPSYPFPYVPGTPRTWSSGFHRPFTTLSPTVSTGSTIEAGTPHDRPNSEVSTPAASATNFMPPSYEPSNPTDEGEYPTPNLYDLVLTLNLEPGLHSWWENVSRILHENFGADRVSLALPADAGELENVPWGQKATFNISGEPLPSTKIQEQSERESVRSDSVKSPDKKFPLGRLRNVFDDSPIISPSPMTPGRPPLASRHSYAGFERKVGESASTPSTPGRTTQGSRPQLPLRTKSYAPHVLAREDTPTPKKDNELHVGFVPLERTLSMSKDGSISDTDFSTLPPEPQAGAHFQVLPILRALNFEVDALLEASSVNRILERGKLVALTRDYTSDRQRDETAPKSRDASTPAQAAHEKSPITNRHQDLFKGKLSLDQFKPGKARPSYEEYEQFPNSPWSQSPAPSPAIQADPDSNPFFTAGNPEEESFRPPEASPVYSQKIQVEAIGVDEASTVIHLPLIHPRVPSNLPFRRTSLGTPVPKGVAEGRASPLKKAPIAILSFIAPTVPYPQNLLQSLQLLAPHLATSFEIAQQFTDFRAQNEAFQRRRSTLYGLSEGVEDGLGDLMDADIDFSNDSTSLTSPSDYSGRSRQSPGGSIGTPAWDHSSFSIREQVLGTPGQQSNPDRIDSYFDAKRRIAHAPSSGGRGQESPGQEVDPHHHRKISNEDKSSGRRPQKGPTQPSLDVRDRKHHTLLHSYGADFNTTFHGTPAAMTPARTPGRTQDQGKIVSSQGGHDMPAPSERLLRIIIDSLPVQIFTAAPSTGILTWINYKFVAYRGQESQQILQDPWQAIHPEDRPQYMEEWQKSLGTGQPFSHKVRLQRFDGAYRWFFVRASALKDRKQRTVHWAGTYMDIHEQHIAELNAARQQETAASEAKYRALANSSPQIVFAVTRTRGLTFCNSQWTKFSGQTESQATGLGFMDYVHADDLSKCRLPSLNEDGSLIVDVPTSLPTDPKDALRPGSDESSDSGKTVTSPGSLSPETIQMPQAKLYKLASTGILKVSRDQDGRPSYSTEVRLRSKDGDYRWHLVRVLLTEPIRTDGSEEETWYGTCTDINDHKLLEQTLKDTMDAKSRFLSNMSHEIRTPLNGITGMVNFLIDSNLSPEQMEHVNIIRNSTEGLRDLINDILDLSKVEAGMITLAPGWLHVRSLIEEVNDIMFALAVDKGLELNYLVEEDVPSMVKGDRFRIRQVLLNVVGNAIKFTQQGEIFVKCEVQQQAPPDTKLAANELLLLFQVIDTGAGFTEKEAEFLFKRFSQIDSTGGKENSGTGLGLAISMQLVELHGGKMTASSVPGKGSTFTFTVKFALPSEEDRPILTASTSEDDVITSSAALIPTPLPINESSQGISFARARPQGQASNPTSPSQDSRTASAPSSGSSDPSLRAGTSSATSHRSSVSSFASEAALSKSPPMALELPVRHRSDRPTSLTEPITRSSSGSTETVTQRSPDRNSIPPTMFSILVLCPLVHTRESIVKHIEITIPKSSPHHITSRAGPAEAQSLLIGDDAVKFTHVVLDMQNVKELVQFLEQVLHSPAHAGSSIVILTDLAQRREIGQESPSFDIPKLESERRLRFVFKPLKPSKMAVVFDPRKESELSTDRNQDSAQAVAVSQKQIFDDLKKRVGNRGSRVLLVEDNKTNQMVLLKFLNKVNVTVECALDGVQCTDKVFAQPQGYYSLILCDLHMPNKDGYQTCKEIRRWERKHRYPYVPIIALSANVLGDVYSKCVDAGFNSYVTKPVDFKELGTVMTDFLDPEDPSIPPEFMKARQEL